MYFYVSFIRIINYLFLFFYKCQWSPDKSSVFGSSAEDGVLNIWDHNKVQTNLFLLLTNLPSLEA